MIFRSIKPPELSETLTVKQHMQHGRENEMHALRLLPQSYYQPSILT